MTFDFERSKIADGPISAIVTAYQAEKTLADTVRELLAELNKPPSGHEIIIVDDGSTDATNRIAADLASSSPHVRHVRHEQPQGYGASLRDGLLAAQHPLVLTMPAEGYRPDDLPLFLKVIDQVDAVIGVRRPSPKSRLFGCLVYLLFGLSFKDPSCPYRLYRRSIFTPRLIIQSKTQFADVELLAKMNFMNCLFTEVEVAWTPSVTPPPVAGSVSLDMRRLFFRPDFGPATLPQEPATPV